MFGSPFSATTVLAICCSIDATCWRATIPRLMRAAHDIGRGERFEVADLMEQVRTEECSLRFFEEDTSVPAVGQMGSLAVTKAVLPRRKGPAVSEGA
jgi:hypothetical protein